MQPNKPKRIWRIIAVFLIASIAAGALVFTTSQLSGEWFSSIFLGVLFGWAICAPIIRISYGAVPFLRIFAVLPVLLLPIMGLIKALPSKSMLFIPLPPAFFLLSLSYLAWLHGLEFFVLFKRSTWSRLFNPSNPDDLADHEDDSTL